jgi:hypothetical protein
MNAPPPNELEPETPQPPMAAAMVWVTRITTISLEMVLPAAGGYWLDQRMGTRFGVVVGMLFGAIAGFYHLMSITRSLPGPSGSGQARTKQKDQP